MRILFITDSFPYPAVSGDRLRVYNLVKRIAIHHEVWLAGLIESQTEKEGIKNIKQFCAGVITAPIRRSHPIAHLPGLLSYGLAGKPLELKFQYSKELADKIQGLSATMKYNIVQIEPSYLAPYNEILVMNSSCKRILGFHNVASDQYKQIYSIQKKQVPRIRAWLHSTMMRRWEPRYAEKFDRCLTVSNVDRKMLIAANPRLKIDVIPNGVDTRLNRPLGPSEICPSLLFVGTMNYAPCADAAIYFCKQVLPLIRQMLDDIQVWIVGKNPPPEVTRLVNERVHITGQVDDVVPYYKRSSVCVVPLQAGGGTRLKILEAMALGRPVISTSTGCEGLDVVDGQHLLIADKPAEFAKKTVLLLKNRVLYDRISAKARNLVVDRYDWDAIAKKLDQVYSEVVQSE